MDEGFILSNKYRRAIFDEFAAGEVNIRRIAKKHRIIQTVAQRVVDDFIKGGIVEKQGNERLCLYQKGREACRKYWKIIEEENSI